MKLIATKSLTYATRRLRAGDSFSPRTVSDGRVLVAIGKARPRIAADDAAASATEELAALREEYITKLGKRPFNGWDAATLAAKIAEA